MKRIFLLAHFQDDSEQMLGPYSSIEEAVDQQSSWEKGMHYDVEFSYCGELFWTIHSGCWFDRTEDFIKEWERRDPNGSPRMRVPSKHKRMMEAAE